MGGKTFRQYRDMGACAEVLVAKINKWVVKYVESARLSREINRRKMID
jgi:hypothetical protein